MSVFLTLFNSLVGLTGFIAVAMIVIGGVRYTVSGGDLSKIANAKNTIVYAVVGLIIAMIGYALVNFVIDALPGAAELPPDPQTLWETTPVVVSGGSTSFLLVCLFALRRSSVVLRWVGAYSAFWMPAAEREDHLNDMWCALHGASLPLRLRLVVGLLLFSPWSGLRCRRARTRFEEEVLAEVERFA